jgi:hypothetical protein
MDRPARPRLRPGRARPPHRPCQIQVRQRRCRGDRTGAPVQTPQPAAPSIPAAGLAKSDTTTHTAPLSAASPYVRPTGKALTTDHPTPRRRKEVKREGPGQEGVRAGGVEPPRVAPPGPKLPTRCAGRCSPGLYQAFELGGRRSVVSSCTRASQGVAARPVSNRVSIGGSGPARSRTPAALRSSATRDRSAGRARQGRCSPLDHPTLHAASLTTPCRGPGFSG